MTNQYTAIWKEMRPKVEALFAQHPYVQRPGDIKASLTAADRFIADGRLPFSFDYSIPPNTHLPTFHTKLLYPERRRSNNAGLHLHQFVNTDDPRCYHSHPYYAIRAVLIGGYIEEMEDRTQVECAPGHVDLVTPQYCHRIHSFISGGQSQSLWFHGRWITQVELRGSGWKK